METVKNAQVLVNRPIHIFTCDRCEKELGSSQEYDDGYYEKFGQYKQSIQIDKTWYIYHATLCEDCARVRTTEITEAIKAIGFEREGH